MCIDKQYADIDINIIVQCGETILNQQKLLLAG